MSLFNDGDYSYLTDGKDARERRRFKMSIEDKNNIEFPLNLSVVKINQIMQTAPSKDEGILTVYQEFCEDSQIFGKSIGSLAKVMNEFNKNVSIRLKTISRIDPSGSHIPVAGVFFNYANSGIKFGEKLVGYVNELVDEYTEYVIAKKKIIFQKYNDFHTNGDIIKINYLEKENNQHSKIWITIGKVVIKARNLYKIICDEMDQQIDSIVNAIDRVGDNQEKRQKIRAIIKGLTMGMGGGGIAEHIVNSGNDFIIDIGHDLLADIQHELFTPQMIKSLSSSLMKEIIK